MSQPKPFVFLLTYFDGMRRRLGNFEGTTESDSHTAYELGNILFLSSFGSTMLTEKGTVNYGST